MNMPHTHALDISDDQVKVKQEVDDVKSEPTSKVWKMNSAKYSEEDLLKAVDEVRRKNMSQATASKFYKVPRSTIFDMLNRMKHKHPKLKPKDEPGEETKPSIKNKPEDPQEMMKHTNNIINIMENSNATPIRCHGDGGYMCCFCDQQYHNPADLKTHTLNSHDDETKRTFTKGKRPSSYFVKLDITALKCKICERSIETLEQFIEHLIYDHKKLMYSDIKNHILPFKFDTGELRCVVCGNVFNKFKVLQEHLNVHYKNYKCDICDAGFVARIILYNHSNGHKTGVFKCELCSKVYDTQRKLRSHQNAVHKFASMVSKCGYCNEKFKNYHRKIDHLTQVHGVTPMSFSCKACDKHFRSQAALRIHTKRDHLMERRFKCSQCDMKFFAKLALDGHMLKHTGVRQFQCDVCLKFYARKTTLREHMRIHENNRRFKCEHCGAAFVQKCSWRGHLRSKHGVMS